MHTLQEFIAFTKGWEYIIAIVFLFLFIGFWALLSAPKTERAVAKQEEKAPARSRRVRRAVIEAPRPSRATDGVPIGLPQWGNPAPASASALQAMAGGAHCWDMRGCPENSRNTCPAYARPDIPCWEARKLAIQSGPDGNGCAECNVYALVATRPGD